MDSYSLNATSPAVSVVIPTRNCLAYLPAAIASVEAQQVSGVEIIVVDDGSSDGTADWLQEKRRAMPWLVVLHGRGDGPNVSRNRAIAVARAPLIAFLDADDLWLPGKLAAQLAFHASDRKAVFSFTDYLHIDPDGGNHGTCFQYWPAFRRLVQAARSGERVRRLDHAAARILAESVVGTSTVVARREALQRVGAFDVSLRSAADWDLWLRLTGLGPVGFTTALGVRYLMHRPGSVSSDARLRIACMRRILMAHAPRVVLHPGGVAAVRRAQAHILATEAELARVERRYAAAAIARLGALRRAPSLALARGLGGDLLGALHGRHTARV